MRGMEEIEEREEKCRKGEEKDRKVQVKKRERKKIRLSERG